jgi:NADH pyrophosphatase NudC (nudix superfamily)
MARIRVESYKFCPQCGGPLERRQFKAGDPEQLFCPRCYFIFYLDPKLVVIALVPKDGGLVLVRQAKACLRDSWVLPGGFVDLGEPLEEAVTREVLEETHLSVRVNCLFKAYSYPGAQKVVLTYVTESPSGELAPGDEILEARVFTPEKIPWDRLGFRTTRETLQDYLRSLGLVLHAR